MKVKTLNLQQKWLKERYQDIPTAKFYLRDRFSEPLWQMVHQKEVNFINNFFKKNKPKKILDLATGPGRIARDLKYFKEGIALDFNQSMLKEAKLNLDLKKWQVLKGDAFNLNFKGEFDAVLCFRFLRHFNLADRKKIYKQIKKVLRPKGYLIFEALNKNMKRGKYIEKFTGAWDKTIKDEIYTLTKLKKELLSVGFKLIKSQNILNNWSKILKKQKEFSSKGIKGKKLIRKLILEDKVKSQNNFLWITLWQLK